MKTETKESYRIYIGIADSRYSGKKSIPILEWTIAGKDGQQLPSLMDGGKIGVTSGAIVLREEVTLDEAVKKMMDLVQSQMGEEKPRYTLGTAPWRQTEEYRRSTESLKRQGYESPSQEQAKCLMDLVRKHLQ